MNRREFVKSIGCVALVPVGNFQETRICSKSKRIQTAWGFYLTFAHKDRWVICYGQDNMGHPNPLHKIDGNITVLGNDEFDHWECMSKDQLYWCGKRLKYHVAMLDGRPLLVEKAGQEA